MNTITGSFAEAIIYTDDIEDYAKDQVKMICDNEISKGSKIRIMPDVHPGKVGPIGLTMTIRDRVIPNLLGVDIGCGMLIAKVKTSKGLEFQKLDTVIRENIPSGFSVRNSMHRMAFDFDPRRLCCPYIVDKMNRNMCALGTLGGGNHFIEVDKGKDDSIYVVIHSGSRHFGVDVTEWYSRVGQDIADEYGISVPYEMSYLDTENMIKGYIQDVQIAQEFASLNRQIMMYEILKGMKWKEIDSYECMHNFIEPLSNGEWMLRKGAISAKQGERVIIPANMRDGIILGIGKGNPDWNESAPHGSGRVYSRSEVKNHFTVSQFKKEMKGIYSTCIDASTLDEAPFAYRDINVIKDAISDTVEITQVLKPLYNFKAGDKK